MPTGDPTETIAYRDTAQDEQTWRQALVGNTSAVDVVDRSRWTFDEGGFSKALNSALLRAQQDMREKAKSLHDDLVAINHPSDYQVTVDGQPIDKASFER
jgi:hypothetical protein